MGLSLLVAQSAVAFNVIKWLGVVYLVYLGLRLLLRRAPSADVQGVAASGARRALVEGIVVEALARRGRTGDG
jgi:threonine/homoserine/homoserine lactone efflux protein